MIKNNQNKKFKAISLFAGCGGMDVAAKWAGIDVIYANELVPVFCDTLRKNFPETTVTEGDIANFEDFPEADIVFGGYPCQSFSMGGNRKPENDKRTLLYLQFAKVLNKVNPKFFIAENVSGLKKINGGKFLNDQLEAFEKAGSGYRISAMVIDAKDYGIPQSRKRILLIGVRNDLNLKYKFPLPTHGKKNKKNPDLLPYVSHGECIKDLPINPPKGEYYERPNIEGTFSWYFMSRNRKKNWDEPAFTVVANWRHITLHPACPKMKLVWSDLANGWKQKWDFSNEYEHIKDHPERSILKEPRRLTWHECARIQTFPDDFTFEGKVEEKFTQIGNAVPPRLFEIFLKSVVSGSNLFDIDDNDKINTGQLHLWNYEQIKK